MSEFIIPPSPHWYKNGVMTCAPDNTLVYASKYYIVIVRETGPEEVPHVRAVATRHVKSNVSVSLNPKWKDPHEYVVSMTEDGILDLWDLGTYEIKYTNKELSSKETGIGAVFAGDNRVVGATSSGSVIVWSIHVNETRFLQNLFGGKVTVTCLSSCPHAAFLVAFGMQNGSVVIADLRKNGSCLFKLRGHKDGVVSLSWCPAPINIFPTTPRNTVKVIVKDAPKPSNLWTDLAGASNASAEQPPDNDFLKECENLKNKILGLEEEKMNDSKSDDSIVETHDIENVKEVPEEQILDDSRTLPQHFDPESDICDHLIEDEDKLSESTNNSQPKSSNLADDEEKLSESLSNVSITTDNSQPKTCPPNPSVEEDPRPEFLLASSGRDKTICIWRASTDGRLQSSFMVPFPKKGRARDAKAAHTWITLCWIAPNKILTSSVTGELLAWTLPRPRDANNQFKMVHFEHSNIFNIVTPPKLWTEHDWKNDDGLAAWTVGQEGLLINYNLSTNKVQMYYSLISSFVVCENISPSDPNRLALGTRDGVIRVWDLSIPHIKTLNMAKYSKKINTKVTSVAWHPNAELILGFGTEEGRVGFIELTHTKTILFPNYFVSQIYKVEWGPLDGDKTNLGLYVVAEGKVAIYNMKEHRNDPVIVEVPENPYIYKFAWKPDFSILLLSTKDGALLVLDTEMKQIANLYLHSKGMTGMLWHPDSHSSDTSVSQYCNWFAGNTTNGFLIYNCDLILSGGLDNENYMEQIVASLEGHLKTPVSLAWSPFEGNKIVSTAADGLAHVWDVSTQTIIATFVDPFMAHNPVVVWSTVDPDVIIVADRLIQVWRVSKNPPKVDEAFLAQRRELLKMSLGSDKSSKKKPEGKKIPKNCIVPAFYSSSDQDIELQVANMRKLMNLDDNKFVEAEGGKMGALQLFGEREHVVKMLETNYNNHKKAGNHKYCQLIALWNGTIGEEIKNAINENRVTPQIIMLAPMVSHKLWQEACDAYAKKLSEEADSDPLENAMIFLARHKLNETIDNLSSNHLYREALALAKCRLPEGSEVTTQIINNWGTYNVHSGNYETAAHCYIATKKYEEAANVLSRRSNVEFLELAAELAEKAGNKELLASLNYKCEELRAKKEEQGPKKTRSEVLLEMLAKKRISESADEGGSGDAKPTTSGEGDSTTEIDLDGKESPKN